MFDRLKLDDEDRDGIADRVAERITGKIEEITERVAVKVTKIILQDLVDGLTAIEDKGDDDVT